ncbi:MAG: prepilin-type N-terminal cleavage/methylation domain-containing protein [bacterium]|nr:prepilin-type N-terminal cleavage/methylation domain-containing protein [bacterium]
MVHRQHGFTLLEIVLTSAILAALAAVGILSYGSFNRTIDVNTIADNISGQLRRAQIRAMGADELKCWGVHFDNPASGSDFYSLYSDTACTNADTGYAADAEKYFFPAGVVFTTPATNATENILFNKLSGALITDSATSIVIETADGKQSKTITINSVGRVSY